MTVVGLTGNIGSGKSTVGKLLAEAGFLHIDADLVGRMVVEPGRPANAELRREFGDEFFDERGNLRRKELGAYVFARPERLRRLNEITHPAIGEEIAAEIAAGKKQDPVRHIVVEAALLLESGMDTLVDRILLVTADTEIRLKRVMARDGLDPRLIRDRMARQMSQEEKEKIADYRIVNNGTLSELETQVAAFLAALARENSETTKKATLKPGIRKTKKT